MTICHQTEMSDLLAVFILDLVNDDALLANTTAQLEALKTSSEQFFRLISDLHNHLPPINLADIVETQNQSLQTLSTALETLRVDADALRRTAEHSLQRVVPGVENCMTTDNFTDSTPHHHNCPKSGALQAVIEQSITELKKISSTADLFPVQKLYSWNYTD